MDAQTQRYSTFTCNEKRYIVLLIALAGWFSTLSSFIYYPVIALVAKDLHTSIARINLTVTSYLAVSGIAPAFVGDAADMLGRRPLYMLTLIIYVAANIGIALQDSFVALLLLRMLQSLGISGRFEQLSIRTIFDMSPARYLFHRLRRHCRYIDACRKRFLCSCSVIWVSIVSYERHNLKNR